MNQDQVENYGRTAQGVAPSGIKRTAWNPAEFAYSYQRADLSKRVRIWADMKASDRRLYLELDMFRRFTRTAGINYKPESEVTLEPNSASPPPPDIACQGEERPLYFELGEVIAEGHAAAAAKAERERLHTYGGPVDLWRPLLRIFAKKLRKRYNPSATPIDLLLYYGVGRQASFWPFLASGLRDRSPWIQQRVDRGPFATVWLYDAHADAVLARFAPSQTPFIR